MVWSTLGTSNSRNASWTLAACFCSSTKTAISSGFSRRSPIFALPSSSRTISPARHLRQRLAGQGLGDLLAVAAVPEPELERRLLLASQYQRLSIGLPSRGHFLEPNALEYKAAGGRAEDLVHRVDQPRLGAPVLAEHEADTDQQIGRLVKVLKDAGLFDNTMIYLLSDNGGAPEGGVKGGFFHNYGDRTSVRDWYLHLDELGTDKTLPLYQRPWAMASDTPFKFYKLWPYRGGVQTPLIVSWPAGIKQPGLRTQFVDIIDITPTVLDIIGIDAPTSFNGICQIPLQGKSIRATFNHPKSPNPRDTQYFELWGARGIYHAGWEAVAIHQPGKSFDDDHWQLFHTDSDFSQCVNLATQHPDKLEELKNLWWSEAQKNLALPLLEASGGRQHTYDQALPAIP